MAHAPPTCYKQLVSDGGFAALSQLLEKNGRSNEKSGARALGAPGGEAPGLSNRAGSELYRAIVFTFFNFFCVYHV